MWDACQADSRLSDGTTKAVSSNRAKCLAWWLDFNPSRNPSKQALDRLHFRFGDFVDSPLHSRRPARLLTAAYTVLGRLLRGLLKVFLAFDIQIWRKCCSIANGKDVRLGGCEELLRERPADSILLGALIPQNCLNFSLRGYCNRQEILEEYFHNQKTKLAQSRKLHEDVLCVLVNQILRIDEMFDGEQWRVFEALPISSAKRQQMTIPMAQS